MRKSPSLDPLLSRPVQGILTVILLEREAPWYLSDLAKRLKRTPSTLQRPLDSLVNAGIVRRYSEGNRVYFERDRECPFLSELQGLLAKTVGLAEVLRESLRKFVKRISVAFVYGSVARSEETSRSDIDLLVVGNMTLADLAPALGRVEEQLGRPVNATIFSGEEFRDKLKRKNHFLRSVLAKEKIFVLGAEHELDELTKPRAGRAARHR
jgi:predicted nucleotidyltransferase